MHFTRKRKTKDDKDIELGCQFFLYAYGGDIRNNGIRKSQFQAVSSRRICLCPRDDIKPTSSLPPRGPKPTPMLMCPSNCSISSEECQNDLECRPLWEVYHRTCHRVIEWNGNGRKPQCSDECKYSIRNLTSVQQGMLYTCCHCDNEACRRGKRNFKDLCGVSPSENDMCKKMHSVCGGVSSDNKKGRVLLCS